MNKNLQLFASFAAGAALMAFGLPALKNVSGDASNDEHIKQIVRQVISDEPKLILDSVRNMQDKGRADARTQASEAMKDEKIRKAMYYNDASPYAGPEDAEKVVVEFFDYNCPACKVQYAAIAELLKKHDNVKVVFMEFPIFGPQSDTNAKIALAVHQLNHKKYIDFHEKMMNFQGRADEAQALKFVKEIGLDPEKVKKESTSAEVEKTLALHRELGSKIKVQGTPTVIVSDEVVPHAVSMQELTSKLKL